MEPHKVVYVAPPRAALAALLRRHARRAVELADALPPDLTDGERKDSAREAVDLEARTALHRMVLDLDEQLRRCERAAGLTRTVHAAPTPTEAHLPSVFAEGA